jgi:hypothetical protein
MPQQLVQLVSVVGALMILGAYAAYQQGRLGREDVLYNLLNVVGSALLAWIAVLDRRWGFILLESAWALLSLPPLVAAWRGGARPGRERPAP